MQKLLWFTIASLSSVECSDNKRADMKRRSVYAYVTVCVCLALALIFVYRSWPLGITHVASDESMVQHIQEPRENRFIDPETTKPVTSPTTDHTPFDSLVSSGAYLRNDRSMSEIAEVAQLDETQFELLVDSIWAELGPSDGAPAAQAVQTEYALLLDWRLGDEISPGVRAKLLDIQRESTDQFYANFGSNKEVFGSPEDIASASQWATEHLAEESAELLTTEQYETLFGEAPNPSP